jgi:hypothetical protein
MAAILDKVLPAAVFSCVNSKLRVLCNPDIAIQDTHWLTLLYLMLAVLAAAAVTGS